MKAVVLEIRDGEAAVLREDGVIVRVRRQCEVGDTIEIAEEKKILSLRSFRNLAAAACLALALTGGGAYGYTTALACTYVSVDAQTAAEDDGTSETAGSVEYVLNRRNRVIRAEGAGEGGEALAAELMKRGAKGMELPEALRLAEEVLREQTPETDAEPASLLVNVSADSADRRQLLVNGAREALRTETGSMPLEITESTLEDRKAAQELGLSTGRYEKMRREEGKPAETAAEKKDMTEPEVPGETIRQENTGETAERGKAGEMTDQEKPAEAPEGKETGETAERETPADRKRPAETADRENPAVSAEEKPAKPAVQSGESGSDRKESPEEAKPAEAPAAGAETIPENGASSGMEALPEGENHDAGEPGREAAPEGENGDAGDAGQGGENRDGRGDTPDRDNSAGRDGGPDREGGKP